MGTVLLYEKVKFVARLLEQALDVRNNERSESGRATFTLLGYGQMMDVLCHYVILRARTDLLPMDWNSHFSNVITVLTKNRLQLSTPIENSPKTPF